MSELTKQKVKSTMCPLMKWTSKGFSTVEALHWCVFTNYHVTSRELGLSDV